MNRARMFFYVCVGIFLLALSYHFGARSAGAQAQAPQYVLGGSGNPWVSSAGGDVWTYICNGGPWQHFGTVPSGMLAGRTVVGVMPSCDSGASVLLSDGTLLRSPDGASWINAGRAGFGPTAATPQTMGQLRARYR